MYLLPENPFSQAVEAYRDNGEALCSKGMHAVPPPPCYTGSPGNRSITSGQERWSGVNVGSTWTPYYTCITSDGLFARRFPCCDTHATLAFADL